ncbi:Aldehyde dehydrogenase [hydrothermal vent metagenome]|uniref:Aldehyde dehydrogenase n=1 Tax=hydrothermal vent metagenome TaxID=652676 RepID=A0A3B1AI20_9ZZZZ
MTKHYPLMIQGVTSSASTHTVTAPYDDSVIATMDTADMAAVETALKTASNLFNNKKNWLAVPERIAILQKTAQLMTEQAEQLAKDAALEGGKPLIDSRVEVARAIDGVHNCIDCMRNDSGREIPMGINPASQNHIAFTRKEPIGVVVAVSAFNHPLNLIIHQVGPAIATGCPVIIKPAEDTPLSCYRFVTILRQAGLPEAWCQALVVENKEVASALVSDARVGFFSFIGSAAVGWMLRSKLAAGARCALEHGGVAPVIIEADADLKDALPLLAKGGFYHAGQVCVSVQRIFCHQSIARSVAEQLTTLAKQQIIGDPTLEQTQIGPLIRKHEVERIHDWVTKAVSEGAKLLTGGVATGNCYAATVLFNPADSSLVSQKEIFGPVICVYSYDSIDEALQRANALDVAFQASVFTKNIDQALYVYSQLNASAVMINDHTAFRVDWMPFAGLRHSGLGVGGIPHTYEDMQIEKMAVIRSKSI